MIRYFYILLVALELTACSGEHDKNKPGNVNAHPNVAVAATPHEQKKPHTILADTGYVKNWLTGIIENYTNSNDRNAAYANMRRSLTDAYYTYKQDAINLEYYSDNQPMTKQEFDKKWNGTFNTKFIGTGGFIISAQDNGRVKVTRCQLLSRLGDTAMVYNTLIEDLDLKTKFNRDFKIIAQNNTLLIADIKEYD